MGVTSIALEPKILQTALTFDLLQHLSTFKRSISFVLRSYYERSRDALKLARRPCVFQKAIEFPMIARKSQTSSDHATNIKDSPHRNLYDVFWPRNAQSDSQMIESLWNFSGCTTISRCEWIGRKRRDLRKEAVNTVVVWRRIQSRQPVIEVYYTSNLLQVPKSAKPRGPGRCLYLNISASQISSKEIPSMLPRHLWKLNPLHWVFLRPSCWEYLPSLLAVILWTVFSKDLTLLVPRAINAGMILVLPEVWKSKRMASRWTCNRCRFPQIQMTWRQAFSPQTLWSDPQTEASHPKNIYREWKLQFSTMYFLLWPRSTLRQANPP